MNQEIGTRGRSNCANLCCVILHALAGLSWSLVLTSHWKKVSSGTIYYNSVLKKLSCILSKTHTKDTVTLTI
jgi:hypothetical protein